MMTSIAALNKTGILLSVLLKIVCYLSVFLNQIQKPYVSFPPEKQIKMRGDIIMAIVRYTLETLPPISKKDLDRVDAIKDEDIDYSDIPEVTDFSKFHPWEQRQMFKPIKVSVTCKLDADVVAWLKQDGKGYQTRLNAILRQAMAHSQ